MKKSEIYKLAQMTVLRDFKTPDKVKLEILRELQDKESLALFVEDREAAENERTDSLDAAIAEVKAFARGEEKQEAANGTV